MKRCLLLAALICAMTVSVFGENRSREEGTIVRMRMTDCVGLHRSFLGAMSGGGQAAASELCPEYVLVTSKVVYVIVGKGSDQLIPLAESTMFHIQNSEVVIRIDDARKEARFHVKEMVLRTEWDRRQQIEEEEALAAVAAHRQLGATAMVSLPQ